MGSKAVSRIAYSNQKISHFPLTFLLIAMLHLLTNSKKSTTMSITFFGHFHRLLFSGYGSYFKLSTLSLEGQILQYLQQIVNIDHTFKISIVWT